MKMLNKNYNLQEEDLVISVLEGYGFKESVSGEYVAQCVDLYSNDYVKDVDEAYFIYHADLNEFYIGYEKVNYNYFMDTILTFLDPNNISLYEFGSIDLRIFMDALKESIHIQCDSRSPVSADSLMQKLNIWIKYNDQMVIHHDSYQSYNTQITLTKKVLAKLNKDNEGAK